MPTAKLVSTPKQQAATRDGSLVEKSEAAQTKQRRVLTKQNTDQQVSRCIMDNFKDLSEAEVRGIRVEGLTLTDRLARDKRANRHGDTDAPKMGKFYMASARDMYCLAKRAGAALTVADKNVEINMALVEGITAAVAAVPDYSKLLGLFQTMDGATQTDIVGICKFLLDLKPNTSAQKTAVIVEAMRSLKRLGSDVAYPEIMESMRMHFDSALVSALGTMKSSGMQKPLQTFWSVYRSRVVSWGCALL